MFFPDKLFFDVWRGQRSVHIYFVACVKFSLLNELPVVCPFRPSIVNFLHHLTFAHFPGCRDRILNCPFVIYGGFFFFMCLLPPLHRLCGSDFYWWEHMRGVCIEGERELVGVNGVVIFLIKHPESSPVSPHQKPVVQSGNRHWNQNPPILASFCPPVGFLQLPFIPEQRLRASTWAVLSQEHLGSCFRHNQPRFRTVTFTCQRSESSCIFNITDAVQHILDNECRRSLQSIVYLVIVSAQSWRSPDGTHSSSPTSYSTISAEKLVMCSPSTWM